ncbi:hypothetical protein PABG_12153 [Paracoccidioides brasiliensis Pb03]|nr:hypothetical protein PABG_12153 [Paracoccidioides brasiliensis Pb03]
MPLRNPHLVWKDHEHVQQLDMQLEAQIEAISHQ